MNSEKDRQPVLDWYQTNKVAADHIINDLRKQTYEAVMHIYVYTAKHLQLEYVVSQKDFPHLFSNHYTRVGNGISGIMALLIGEWNINIGKNTIDNTLCYWLTCGNLYETLVSKIIINAEEAKGRLEQNGFTDLKEQLIVTSIANHIKAQEDWNHFFGLNKQVDKAPDKLGHVEKRIPIELQTDEAQQILSKAIALGLCDKEYHWQKSKSLLAYFADCASVHLNLTKAEQDGKKKTLWKPFESLFNVSGLATYKNTYTNKTGKLPSEHEIVESIFE